MNQYYCWQIALLLLLEMDSDWTQNHSRVLNNIILLCIIPLLYLPCGNLIQYSRRKEKMRNPLAPFLYAIIFANHQICYVAFYRCEILFNKCVMWYLPTLTIVFSITYMHIAQDTDSGMHKKYLRNTMSGFGVHIKYKLNFTHMWSYAIWPILTTIFYNIFLRYYWA